MGLKRVLIISPYFPPTNAADMQRVRMSLPYFKDLGWEAEIVTVDPAYSDLPKDDLLSQSLPQNNIVHYTKALRKKWTGKLGLGSIALRSMWFYRRTVNSLLRNKKYDLIYFSTTQFPVCVLGAYWKKRFGIPYVIDMQDPWHSEYYRDKPKDQRPPKHWFSYRLNKWLEPIAMRSVSGLVSVSKAYIVNLKDRYPIIRDIPAEVITFGAFERDFEIAGKNVCTLNGFSKPKNGEISIRYVGRGGYDMHTAVKHLFAGFKKGLDLQPGVFTKFHFYFTGTSYAAADRGTLTILPIADALGIGKHVSESPERISFYESIAALQSADMLFIPGSDDSRYTASKLFPYILSKKPILAIFHEDSSAVEILKTSSPGASVFTFPDENETLAEDIYQCFYQWATVPAAPLIINEKAFSAYSAPAMAAKQVALFDQVLLLQN